MFFGCDPKFNEGGTVEDLLVCCKNINGGTVNICPVNSYGHVINVFWL